MPMKYPKPETGDALLLRTLCLRSHFLQNFGVGCVVQYLKNI